jgi:hypothetical protein
MAVVDLTTEWFTVYSLDPDEIPYRMWTGIVDHFAFQEPEEEGAPREMIAEDGTLVATVRWNTMRPEDFGLVSDAYARNFDIITLEQGDDTLVVVLSYWLGKGDPLFHLRVWCSSETFYLVMLMKFT